MSPPGPVPDTPTCLIVVPTFRCPLRCKHCDLPGLHTEQLPGELWVQRLEELAAGVGRPFLVGISGGEPLLYPGIHDILETCARVGLLTSLATSTLPLTGQRVERLLATGLNSLVVPLDGLGLNHDELRRRPGLFEQTVKVMRTVKGMSPALHLSVVTTVTSRNMDQLTSLAHWAWGQPEVINAICYHTLSGNLGGPEERDPLWYGKSPLWPGSHPELTPQLEELIRLRERGLPFVNSAAELRAMLQFYRTPSVPLRPCDQHRRGMLALPQGDVKLCPLTDPVGNLKEQSLLEIWRSEQARTLRREMALCHRNCHFQTNYAYKRHEIPTEQGRQRGR